MRMNPVYPIVVLLRHELGVVLTSTLARLILAALLGGVIGLERQLRHRPAGLRTNMFICFGAAMFTVLSRQLAGVESDSARIAAQIIPGIGFIGAGSILHARTSVTGLTTAATLFVVAGVGMAAGGGNVINVTPDPEHVRTGMKVQLATYVVGTDDEGTEAVGFGFEPVEVD